MAAFSFEMPTSSLLGSWELNTLISFMFIFESNVAATRSAELSKHAIRSEKYVDPDFPKGSISKVESGFDRTDAMKNGLLLKK